jgi:glutathione synthase/RimK-type ligase-like ATP-grasp enzyme
MTALSYFPKKFSRGAQAAPLVLPWPRFHSQTVRPEAVRFHYTLKSRLNRIHFLEHLVISDGTTQIHKTDHQKFSFINPIDFLCREAMPSTPGVALIFTKRNSYLGLGYFAALAAEARGYCVLPSLDTMFWALPPSAEDSDLGGLMRFILSSRHRNSLVLQRAAGRLTNKSSARGMSLAVVYRLGEKLPPSDLGTLRRFQRVAEIRGVKVSLVTPRGLSRVRNIDGIFLRCPNAFWFAKCATDVGIPVIDDPRSILRCNNKLYIAEICKVSGLPRPRTIVLNPSGPHAALRMIEDNLNFPVVLKDPARSFGRGVFKVHNGKKLCAILESMRRRTDVVIAQEFIFSDFDWRIGVLDGKPLFACRYYTLKGYWKVLRFRQSGQIEEGQSEPVPLERVPTQLLSLAVNAATKIGNGLYGVDIKETSAGPVILEVNDNPDLYSHCEAVCDSVWDSILDWFTARVPCTM